MEQKWEYKREVITREEVVARINRCIAQWAEEEKAAAQQPKEKEATGDGK